MFGSIEHRGRGRRSSIIELLNEFTRPVKRMDLMSKLFQYAGSPPAWC
jgi:hypothetical protein